MAKYHILQERYREKVSLSQLKELVDCGEIAPEQEVRQSGHKKTISADYAIIFHQEEVLKETGAVTLSPLKKWLGGIMGAMGIVFCCLLIQAAIAGESVSVRSVLLTVVLTLSGCKIYSLNS